MAFDPNALPATDRVSQADTLYGVDLWFDVSEENAELIITPAGDWKIVRGRECLRQALLRRLLTDPGEWATLPDYGVGARRFVKARNTKATRDELTNRIRSQFLRDPRVSAVGAIAIESLANSAGLKLAIEITPVGELEAGGALQVKLELSR